MSSREDFAHRLVALDAQWVALSLACSECPTWGSGKRVSVYLATFVREFSPRGARAVQTQVLCKGHGEEFAHKHAIEFPVAVRP